MSSRADAARRLAHEAGLSLTTGERVAFELGALGVLIGMPKALQDGTAERFAQHRLDVAFNQGRDKAREFLQEVQEA